MLTSLVPTTQQHHAALAAIQQSARLANSTKAQYSRALRRYLSAGHDLLDGEALKMYAQGLPKSERSFLKSAIKLWADDFSTQIENGVDVYDPADVLTAQGKVMRLRAITKAIDVKSEKGQKTFTWLSAKEVRALLDTCDDSLVGQRDKLCLGLLCCAGLRRQEAADLTFADVVLQPVGDHFRTVLSVCGKGAKERTVPIRDSLAKAIEAWGKLVGGEGRILRSVSKGGEVGEGLCTSAIFNVVRAHGAAIGKPKLAPHDLRRSFARLAYDSGQVTVGQLALILGHSDPRDTMRYIGLEIDLECTASDFVPF